MVEETLRGCTTASFLSVIYIRLITHIKGCQTPSTVTKFSPRATLYSCKITFPNQASLRHATKRVFSHSSG